MRYPFISSALAAFAVLSTTLTPLAEAQQNTLTPPSPQKVVIVVLENHDYQQIVGDTVNAPYLNSVISQGLLYNNAHAIEHPSQPNYLDLFAGSNQGVASVNGTPSNPYDLNALVATLQAAIANPATPASALPGLKTQLAQIQGALAAEEKVGLKMNVPEAKLEAVVKALPALRNPTVSHLHVKGWVAIEVIVDERIVREIVPALKAAGAEGIIEYPLNKVIA